MDMKKDETATTVGGASPATVSLDVNHDTFQNGDKDENTGSSHREAELGTSHDPIQKNLSGDSSSTGHTLLIPTSIASEPRDVPPSALSQVVAPHTISISQHRFALSSHRQTRVTVREQRITKVNANHQEARSPWVKFLGLGGGQRCETVNSTGAVAVETISPSSRSRSNSCRNDTQFRIRSHAVVTRPYPYYHHHRRLALFWWKHYTNSSVSSYLAWTHRASFAAVIVSSYVWFMALIVLYALLIYASVRHEPRCLSSGPNTTYSLMDAFHLSWTTLGTVGYGAVSPTMATTEQRCIGINILMAFEAFVGVLFSGVSAAILIGKIARIQSIAQVRFSNPMCIRYGTAVLDAAEVGDEDAGIYNNHGCFPCPILEFRIINMLSGERGGEILNASVTVVASVTEFDDESDQWKKSLQIRQRTSKTLPSVVQKAAKSTTNAVGTVGSMAVTAGTKVAKQTGTALHVARRRATQTTGSLIQQLNRQWQWTPKDDLMDESLDGGVPPLRTWEARLSDEPGVRSSPKNDLSDGMEERSKRCVAVDEGNAELAPPRVYHKLEIEVDTHPYFKRVWNVRHVLDQSSPLLSAHARQRIIESNGYWPEEYNNYESILAHVRFNDCIVSLSGVANASGSSVHAQKVYDCADVHVGYSFANVLGVKNGFIIVDSVVLHDIQEQMGGGAEPMPKNYVAQQDMVEE